ncbi:PREDICTED: hemolymph lipopolysaccharide-binding protein-like [Ceratosolen solmsi marchali]|uniref:Hemolymph lipopolysaccharide-binding protein-like n=1 Tax=Ceratosolen solmsi marchali TaxID=326594 RepID=A0AAJ6YTK7_9HYME|nr:PREDICTED: hemolymph lipopolysaccharide-binding protein-like [Ceratosolen solmsi marchali]
MEVANISLLLTESKGNGDNLKVEVINNFYGAQCCEQNKDTKVKTTKLPEGYNLTPNVGAHKYYSDLKVWNDARKFCEHEGVSISAHLAIADSEEEMKILEKLIGTAVDTWVGFHDLFTIGDWVTVLDKPVPFYSWSPGNPDLPNAERCGSMRTNGFNNLNCNSAVGFICEVEISK